jgi:hypothetical protein
MVPKLETRLVVRRRSLLAGDFLLAIIAYRLQAGSYN